MGNNKYKEQHKRLGLCVECSRPAILGTLRCLIHTKTNSDRSNSNYKKRRQEGRCPECGNLLLPYDKTIICGNCLEIRTMYRGKS